MTNHSLGQQYPAAASIDSSGVGWVTGGLQSNGQKDFGLVQNDEYTPNTWTNRTNVTTAGMQKGGGGAA